MGCAASAHAKAVAGAPSTLAARPAPPGKPLEEWDLQEVEHWFSEIPRVAQYRSLLLPDAGCVVATWDQQLLVRRGVPEDDAVRIVAYRNKVYRPGAVGLVVGSPAAFNVLASSPTAPTRTQTNSADAAPSGALTGKEGVEDSRSTGVADATQHTRRAEEDVRDKQSKRQSLMALAKQGLTILRLAVEKLGPSLPFPGAQAANLLLQVLNAVDAAVVNSEKLQALRDRALAVMDILDAYQQQLRGLQRYKEVVGRYSDALQGVLSFSQAYASRNCLVRLITVDSDADQYEALAADMAATGEALIVLIAADSNARIQEVEEAVSESRALLREMARCRDPSAEARALVEQLGGIEAVIADNGKVGAVMQKLDVSERITIQAVMSLLQSHLDKGPQRLIRQPELRLFWAQQFSSEAEVPWFAFWEAFPELMRRVPTDITQVEALCALFTDSAARVSFRRAVARNNKDTLSVWELRVSFSGDVSLLQQVRLLLGGFKVQTCAAQGKPSDSVAAGANSAAPSATTGGGAVCFGSHSQLPPLPPSYLGRDVEAAKIVLHLKSRGSLVLLAPGGMGKSCLAADVGWRLLREGGAGGVLWVDLREAASTGDVEARFCAALGLQLDGSDDILQIVECLGGLVRKVSGPAGQVPVLVVVDNAEDAILQPDTADALRSIVSKTLTDAPTVRLLITSRDPIASDGLALTEQHVGAITPDAAVQVVLGAAADLTPAQAAVVAEACYCVPLLLCLVAEALGVGRLALQDVSTLRAKGGGASSTQAMVHVALASLRKAHQLAAVQLATFPTAFQEDVAASVLGISEPEARAMCAVLHRYSVLQRAGPQSYIMHMMVRQMSTHLGGQLDSRLRQHVEKSYVKVFLGLLHEWGTMYRTAKEGTLALAAARDHNADIMRTYELLPAVGESLASELLLITEDVRSMLSTACLTERLQGPCEALLARLESSDPTVEKQKTVAMLQWMLAWILFDASLFSSAEALAQQSWDKRKQLLGVEHPRTLESCSILAACMDGLGQHLDAEQLYREVLEARRRVLGTEHPATLSALHNLAICISNSHRHSEAEPLYREALQLHRRVLGPEHPDTLNSLNSLAAWLNDCDRYAEAEELYREVLEAKQRVLGAEHPDTLLSLVNMAICIESSGRYEEAEMLHKQALEVRRQLLRADHPDTLLSLELVAGCNNNAGRYAEAEQLYRQVLEVRRRVLGADHSDTLGSLVDVALCIENSGRYQEAERLYRQALEVRRQLLGAEHPDTLCSLTYLADCITACGRCVEAEQLYREVLEQQRTQLGEEHPDTVLSLSYLATCIQHSCRYAEAERLHREALQATQSLFGAEHLKALRCLDNLADCLGEYGRYADAEQLRREALQVRQRVLGVDHRYTLESLADLAGSIHDSGRYADAEVLYREALEGRRRVLSVDHPDTLISLDNLAVCVNDGCRFTEAEQLHAKALEAQQRTLGAEYPDTLNSLQNLGMCIHDSGRFAAAEPLLQKVVQARQRLMGAEHPETLRATHDLARCISKCGRCMEAERLLRETLRIQQRVLGPEHRDTLETCHSLARCIHESGRNAEAEPLYRETLAACRRVLDPGHMATLIVLGDMARCLANCGRPDEAEQLHREVLTVQERRLGAEHPAALTSLHGLALCLKVAGRYSESEKLFKKVLEARERLLGSEHPDTVESRAGLSDCMAKKGR